MYYKELALQCVCVGVSSWLACMVYISVLDVLFLTYGAAMSSALVILEKLSTTAKTRQRTKILLLKFLRLFCQKVSNMLYVVNKIKLKLKLSILSLLLLINYCYIKCVCCKF